MNTSTHIPVLLNQVIQALNPENCRVIVDATYGRGGHAAVIIGLIEEHTRVILIDRDPEAIQHARAHWSEFDNVEIIHAPFSELQTELQQRGLFGQVDAILLDFGVSSPQLDQGSRGFSFNHDGPLDMRMDNTRGCSAREWISQVDESELARVLKEFGEEKFSRRIARAIKAESRESAVNTTGSLEKIIRSAIPFKDKHKHPATRTFQAVRIAVNDEIREIELVLPQALEALAPGGRLVVISFHSLEDRLVKRFFRKESKGDPFPLDFPATESMLKPRLQLSGKPVRAGPDEIKKNPRSRSAVLRIVRKVA